MCTIIITDCIIIVIFFFINYNNYNYFYLLKLMQNNFINFRPLSVADKNQTE